MFRNPFHIAKCLNIPQSVKASRRFYQGEGTGHCERSSPCPTAAAAYLRFPSQGSWLCAASCLSVLAASPWAEVRRLATSLPRLSILNTGKHSSSYKQCRGIWFCTSGVKLKAGKRQLLFVQHLIARKSTVVQKAAITIINTQPCLLCVEITRCPLLCAGLGLCRILCLVSVETSAESWC